MSRTSGLVLSWRLNTRPPVLTEGLPDAERGATAAEYALMAGLIALVVFLSVTFIGESLRDIWDELEALWP